MLLIKTARCCLLSFQCDRLGVYLVLTIITCVVNVLSVVLCLMCFQSKKKQTDFTGEW